MYGVAVSGKQSAKSPKLDGGPNAVESGFTISFVGRLEQSMHIPDMGQNRAGKLKEREITIRRAHDFSVRNVPEHFARRPQDPWSDYIGRAEV
jgi:hypothetical protein